MRADKTDATRLEVAAHQRQGDEICTAQTRETRFEGKRRVKKQKTKPKKVQYLGMGLRSIMAVKGKEKRRARASGGVWRELEVEL